MSRTRDGRPASECITKPLKPSLTSCPVSHRIVVSGALLQAAIVPNSAAPYDFQAAYGLSIKLVSVPAGSGWVDDTPPSWEGVGSSPDTLHVSLQAEAISDHYPVEVTLRTA